MTHFFYMDEKDPARSVGGLVPSVTSSSEVMMQTQEHIQEQELGNLLRYWRRQWGKS